jgi:hypothetical protein
LILGITHMKTAHLFRASSTLVLLALCLGTTRCASEPEVKCTVTGGAASARLQLVGAKTGTCDGVVFPFSDTGDVIGLEAYSPIVTDPNINDEVTSFALQSGALGALRDNADTQGLADADASHTAFALGKFDHVYPDAHDVCTASGFTAAELALPTVPAHQDDDGNDVPEQAATHIKYEWSNVRVIVSVNSIGTQTFADLTYTQDGCVAHYQVSLLTPNVGCTDPNDDTKLDPTQCNAESDPSKGFAGSGIGQGISVTCDPDLQMCLPNRMTP